MMRVILLLSVLPTITLAAEDVTTFCQPWFGPGIAVTCQAAIRNDGKPLERCYYENGWWLDDNGAVIRMPQPGGGDQRPRVVDVEPYGYPTLFGFQANEWEPCPGSYFGDLPTPPHVWEWCQAVARSEYHEGEAWCSQWEER